MIAFHQEHSSTSVMFIGYVPLPSAGSPNPNPGDHAFLSPTPKGPSSKNPLSPPPKKTPSQGPQIVILSYLDREKLPIKPNPMYNLIYISPALPTISGSSTRSRTRIGSRKTILTTQELVFCSAQKAQVMAPDPFSMPVSPLLPPPSHLH